MAKFCKTSQGGRATGRDINPFQMWFDSTRCFYLLHSAVGPGDSAHMRPLRSVGERSDMNRSTKKAAKRAALNNLKNQLRLQVEDRGATWVGVRPVIMKSKKTYDRRSSKRELRAMCW